MQQRTLIFPGQCDTLAVDGDVLVLRFPTFKQAQSLYEEYFGEYQEFAERLGVRQIEFRHPDPEKVALQVEARFQPFGIHQQGDPMNSNLKRQSLKELGYLKISEEYWRKAGSMFLPCLDFLRHWEERGCIVTVTSNETVGCKTDKILYVSDRFAPDRRGSDRYRTNQEWIGSSFLVGWHDSFKPGNFNYYAQLQNLVKSNRLPLRRQLEKPAIAGYTYLFRPSGDLRRFWNDYYVVDKFLGEGSVRIAVSRPGDHELVEAGV